MKCRTRVTFGWTVLALGLWTAMASEATAQAVAQDHGKHHAALLKCAQACANCQLACDECATHCAKELAAGNKEHLATLMSCQDCATVCSAAAQIVARGGPFSALICEPCAKACADCAVQCEKFPGDQHMKQCAEECRKCEKACREMLKHLAS